MSILKTWKRKAENLKRDIYSLYYAYHDPQTPWYAKAWVILVVGYAMSPIDLIPDFIPILGYLDDMVLLPMGVWVAIQLIPKKILKKSRIKALEKISKSPHANWVAGGIILLIWVFLIGWALKTFLR